MNNFNVAGCAPLTVTLAGGDDTLDYWTSGDAETEGATYEGSDGYMASYTLTYDPTTDNLTCFGFSEDAQNGYFCVGAMMNEDGSYLQHGAGYWTPTEEEIAEAEEAEAEYAALVEEGFTDEEILVFFEMQEMAEGDDEEEEESTEEWLARGNPMAADYVPAEFCEELYDEELQEMSMEHCFGVETFEGFWYQPYESSSYEGNFRFSAGMEAWVACDASEALGEYTMVIMEGATALTAGAIAILAAAAY
jgi:hypothetical protein